MSALVIICGAILPPAILTMIIVAAVNREKPNAYENFTNGVRTVFAYIFMTCALLTMIIGTISATSSILDYIYPDTIEIVADTELPTVDLSYEKEDMPAGLRIQNDKHRALATFASSITAAVVAVPVFIYFSKQVKLSKKK